MMGDIEKLLLKAVTIGLVENLSRNGIGMADMYDDELHYYLDGRDYLITCTEVTEQENQHLTED